MDIFVNFEDDELPPLIDPERENANENLPPGRVIAMPSECTTNPLQRALADSIIRMVSLDELRILFACGAKVSHRTSNFKLRWCNKVLIQIQQTLLILGERTCHTRSLCASLRRLAEKHRGN